MNVLTFFGYALNVVGLQNDLAEENRKVKRVVTSGSEDTAILDKEYKQRGIKIVQEFKKGLQVQYMDDVDPKKVYTTAKPKHAYHWGLEKRGNQVGYRVGLATTGSKRNMKSNLDFEDLQKRSW